MYVACVSGQICHCVLYCLWWAQAVSPHSRQLIKAWIACSAAFLQLATTKTRNCHLGLACPAVLFSIVAWLTVLHNSLNCCGLSSCEVSKPPCIFTQNLMHTVMLKYRRGVKKTHDLVNTWPFYPTCCDQKVFFMHQAPTIFWLQEVP